jgi:hypothetical protein
MLLATAGTLAANIINNEIAANTIMVTKTAHNPITGRRDAFGANGVCSWKVFDERFTAFRLKQRFLGLFSQSFFLRAFREFHPNPPNPASKLHSNQPLARSPALCKVCCTHDRRRWKTNRGGKQIEVARISSNITAKAVDSGNCGTDNQFSNRRSASRFTRLRLSCGDRIRTVTVFSR